MPQISEFVRSLDIFQGGRVIANILNGLFGINNSKILQVLAKDNNFRKSTIYFSKKEVGGGGMGPFGKFPKTKKQQILRLEASITYLFVKIYICIYDMKLEKLH